METKRKSFLARAAMTLLVTLLLTMTAQTAWAGELTAASGTCGTNCTWTFNTSTGLLTISGSGAMEDYATFEGCTNIKTVVIENGITYIGYQNFKDCSGIKSVSFPASLLTIGHAPFLNCTSISTIDLSGCTLLVSTGPGLCTGCTSLRTVTLPSSIKTIGGHAFEFCGSLQTINLNACTALERICAHAFYQCGNLEGTFSFPTTLKGISSNAFEKCAKLSKVTIANGTTFEDDDDDIQDTGGYGAGTFDDCTALTLSLPDDMMLAILAAEKSSDNRWRDFVGMFDKLPATITGITMSKDGGFVKATFKDDGTPLAIPSNVIVGKLGFDRIMPVDQCATIMLPCADNATRFTGATIYTFTGVSYNSVSGKWEATMTACDGYHAPLTLAANTPYLVKASAASISRENYGNLTLNTTTGTRETTVGDWTFKGVYAEKTWAAGDVGNDYGFAAASGTATDGVTAVSGGDFVKIDVGAHIKPMRAYLTYTGSAAPAMNRTASSLPSSISVVLVEADGSTTTVGTIHMERNTEGWYSLDGMQLNSKPTQKGLYIHNGRKEVVK